jgi:hypothetical protein
MSEPHEQQPPQPLPPPLPLPPPPSSQQQQPEQPEQNDAPGDGDVDAFFAVRVQALVLDARSSTPDARLAEFRRLVARKAAIERARAGSKRASLEHLRARIAERLRLQLAMGDLAAGAVLSAASRAAAWDELARLISNARTRRGAMCSAANLIAVSFAWRWLEAVHPGAEDMLLNGVFTLSDFRDAARASVSVTLRGGGGDGDGDDSGGAFTPVEQRIVKDAAFDIGGVVEQARLRGRERRLRQQRRRLARLAAQEGEGEGEDPQASGATPPLLTPLPRTPGALLALAAAAEAAEAEAEVGAEEEAEVEGEEVEGEGGTGGGGGGEPRPSSPAADVAPRCSAQPSAPFLPEPAFVPPPGGVDVQGVQAAASIAPAPVAPVAAAGPAAASTPPPPSLPSLSLMLPPLSSLIVAPCLPPGHELPSGGSSLIDRLDGMDGWYVCFSFCFACFEGSARCFFSLLLPHARLML